MSTCKRNNPSNFLRPDRKGYKPMQEGYQPLEERGYTAVEGNRPGRPDFGSLPRPPKGGTGESNGSPGEGSSE